VDKANPKWNDSDQAELFYFEHQQIPDTISGSFQVLLNHQGDSLNFGFYFCDFPFTYISCNPILWIADCVC
jgi:hypothetical protein